jgi:TolB-like protein
VAQALLKTNAEGVTMTDSPSAPTPVEVSRKKDRVRSAWISFAGRIAAQIIGAIATVTLGVVVLGKPTAPALHATKASTAGDTVAHVSARVRTPGETVVAVLPLDDYSERPGHFVEGMTEALITDLSQSGQLRVISRTSAAHFKKSDAPLTDAAQRLGADYVVEGSVSQTGGRLRVTAQLIDARTDEHVWARSYERTAADPMTVQAEVAGIIAHEVSGKLSQAPSPQVATTRP